MSASPTQLSLTEWAVLALVVEQPAHGFAIARELATDGDLGRILTVRRPLVYRALDRLVDAELIEPARVEPGDAAPNRTVMHATRRGKAALRKWRVTPVEHVRDLRIEFLLKLRLTERAEQSPQQLVDAQRVVLSETLAALAEPADTSNDDVVDHWRQHNAAAARNFLDAL